MTLLKLLDGKQKKLAAAHFSKICGTTGFVVFYVKDVLEYFGIFEDKKTPPQRMYINYEYRINYYRMILEKLNKMV